jgi:Right handed beta helix region
MKQLLLFLCLLTSCQVVPEEVAPLAVTQEAKASATYYVSAAGSDANAGTASKPFRTLGKIGKLKLLAGTRIFLRGGDTLVGPLALRGTGSANNPIVVDSYGEGKAIIKSTGSAVTATDLSGLHLHNLHVIGTGSGAGIDLRTQKSTVTGVLISGVEAERFTVGIYLRNLASTGFQGTVIENSIAHDNGHVGIFQMADQWQRQLNQNTTIRSCVAYNNLGDGRLDSWSGSGIVLASGKGGLISFCEAYNNGSGNRHVGGGSYGIWVFDASDVNITHSKSHHNHSGMEADGGGFDLDGGALNCSITDCISWENEGPGYGVFEYGSANPSGNHLLARNTSTNDGGQWLGSIALWAAPGYTLRNVRLENNTVTSSRTAIQFYSGTFQNIVFTGNAFHAPAVSNSVPTGVTFL